MARAFTREAAERAGLEAQVAFVTNADSPYTVPDHVRFVIGDTTDGAITVTLPPAGRFVGEDITVILETDGGTSLTLQDADDSTNWSDLTLNDVNDFAVLKCAPDRWIDVASQHSGS